jgi:hemoglobin-like flavoprotein
MSDAATLILESLDRVAEITDDPSAQVYERLFTEYPEFKQLFRHESSGELARQNMFRVTVVALLEHLEGKHSSISRESTRA